MERNADCKLVPDTLLPEDSGEGEAEGRGHWYPPEWLPRNHRLIIR